MRLHFSSSRTEDGDPGTKYPCNTSAVSAKKLHNTKTKAKKTRPRRYQRHSYHLGLGCKSAEPHHTKSCTAQIWDLAQCIPQLPESIPLFSILAHHRLYTWFSLLLRTSLTVTTTAFIVFPSPVTAGKNATVWTSC